MEFHKAVLLKEVLEVLNPKEGQVFADFTIGFGGHAEKILERILPGGFLFGFELESFTFQKVKESFQEKFPEKAFKILNDSYSNLEKYIKNESLDGALFDLGISTYEIKKSGFSFFSEKPLDFRFNKKEGLPFYERAKNLSEKEISEIIVKFGEISKKDAETIAKIVKNCFEKEKITGTEVLEEIKKSFWFLSEKRLKSVLSQVSQSFRIFVNDELENLEATLPKAFEKLKPGGTLCVISFHSLEDRIVKNFFKSLKKNDLVSDFSKRPITPQKKEVLENKSARSAKLRFVKKKDPEKRPKSEEKPKKE